MTVQESRLLERLDLEIASASSEVRVACLQADKAAYLARCGRDAEANAILATIRNSNMQVLASELAIRLSLAEGVQIFFRGTNKDARDKFLRSYAMAVATGARQSIALSAAWLAHMGYAELDKDEIVRYASASAAALDTDNIDAIVRLALVVAQVLHLSGQRRLAVPWYEKVRAAALVRGDEATVLALAHNMAWLDLSMIRRRYCDPTMDAAAIDDRLVENALESHMSMQVLYRDQGLRYLLPALRAQRASFSGKRLDALGIYEADLFEPDIVRSGRFGAILYADFAACLAQVGRLGEAEKAASLAIEALGSMVQVDERASAYYLLAEVFDCVGQPEKSVEYRSNAAVTWERFDKFCLELVMSLSSVAFPTWFQLPVR